MAYPLVWDAWGRPGVGSNDPPATLTFSCQPDFPSPFLARGLFLRMKKHLAESGTGYSSTGEAPSKVFNLGIFECSNVS